MKLRVLDLGLLAATAIGAVASIGSYRQLHDLRRERDRIEATVGRLEITDASVMQVAALDSGEALQWLWRVYLPDQCSGRMTYRSGGGSGSLSFGSGKAQFLARCSFTKTQAGGVGLYVRFSGGSAYASFGDEAFYDFLMAHRQELVIEQLGSQGAAVIKAGAPPARLIKISMPEALAKAARESFSDPNITSHIPVLLEVKVEVP